MLAQKKDTAFYIKMTLHNSPKKSPYIWATFVRNFLTKNLQKSPNLVTLTYSPCHV